MVQEEEEEEASRHGTHWMSSVEEIWLLPRERTLRDLHASKFSMCVMLLLKRVRSVSFVRFSSPSILGMLLKDKSDQWRIIHNVVCEAQCCTAGLWVCVFT